MELMDLESAIEKKRALLLEILELTKSATPSSEEGAIDDYAQMVSKRELLITSLKNIDTEIAKLATNTLLTDEKGALAEIKNISMEIIKFEEKNISAAKEELEAIQVNLRDITKSKNINTRFNNRNNFYDTYSAFDKKK